MKIRIHSVRIVGYKANTVLEIIEKTGTLVPGFYQPDTIPAGSEVEVVLVGFDPGEKVTINGTTYVSEPYTQTEGMVSVRVVFPPGKNSVPLEIVRQDGSKDLVVLYPRRYRTLESVVAEVFGPAVRTILTTLRVLNALPYGEGDISSEDTASEIGDDLGIGKDTLLQLLRSSGGAGVFSPTQSDPTVAEMWDFVNNLRSASEVWSLSPFNLADFAESLSNLLGVSVQIGILPYWMNPLRWGFRLFSNLYVPGTGNYIQYTGKEARVGFKRAATFHHTDPDPMPEVVNPTDPYTESLPDIDTNACSGATEYECFWLLTYGPPSQQTGDWSVQYLRSGTGTPPKVGIVVEDRTVTFYRVSYSEELGFAYYVSPIPYRRIYSVTIGSGYTDFLQAAEYDGYGIKVKADPNALVLPDTISVSGSFLSVYIPVAVLNPTTVETAHLMNNFLLTSREGLFTGADVFVSPLSGSDVGAVEDAVEHIRDLVYYGTLPFDVTLWKWVGTWGSPSPGQEQLFHLGTIIPGYEPVLLGESRRK